MFCLDCGKEIGNISENRICPYCGFIQYDNPNETIMIKNIKRTKKKKIKKSNKKNDEINQWFDMGLF